MSSKALSMDSINWRYLLSHPSEFVRIDEQLRMLAVEVKAWKYEFSAKELMKWTYSAELENDSHLRLINNFRSAVNLFGSQIFNTRIISEEEQSQLETFLMKVSHKEEPEKHCPTLFFEQYNNRPKETFQKLVQLIASRKNTEQVFTQFLVFIYDNFVSAFNENPFLFQTEKEKEMIMHEVIKRIV
jgi:hypothetical protein